VGLVIAAWVGTAFFAVCLAFAILGLLYSHPWSRWKGDPWRSWLTVMIGQGALDTAASGGHSFDAAILGASAGPLIAGAAWVSASSDAGKFFRRVSLFQIGAGGAFALFRLGRS